MNTKKCLQLLILVGFLWVQFLQAEITLPAIVSSNMVLQRDTDVTLWGWADPFEDISIEASWLHESINILADKEGNWKVKVMTTNSKEAQIIKIFSSTSNILLKNILFGEVWLCSGQSNMQQPLSGYNGQPTFGALHTVANANNPNLRLFTVHRKGAKLPLNNIDGYDGWEEASSINVMEFSAVAYFFGEQLQKILDVPVGLIHTSWGGSKVEAWISKEYMNTYQTVDLDSVDINKQTNHIPTALFNAMINPLIPYTIKGTLWYQGESNRDKPSEYKERFPAMVKDWRSRWNIGDFPFYYVQIAPFLYGDNNAFEVSNNSAYIRETQLKCVDLIPNSGIAITMDIGEANCIHPAKKKEVANRLLFIALHKSYGYKTIDFSGPIYNSMIAHEGGLMLQFQNAEKGLYTFTNLTGFEIAGEDKVFYPADAKIINGNRVFVTSGHVKTPVAVRYAWRNWVKGSLFDTNLLPASSFRTDDWNDAKHVE
ncbi:sialate O-acetylesterase [Aestuariivivens sp. NBU2969]|uniref:sialate O-acetylesterase n=1 Tax=Aestuariivivens sp. NBU2969 TaxID=2873267 RepID=UPI001CC141E6|nr:sialate O-acetylesterase [Aestuariivivens sp. NBU2969]